MNGESQGYVLSPQTIEGLVQALEKQELKALQAFIPLYPADAADILKALPVKNRADFWAILPTPLNYYTLVELDDSLRAPFLETLPASMIAEAILTLESDDSLLLLKGLAPDEQGRVFQSLSQKKRAFLEESLSYPPDSVARMMKREVIAVPSFWTVRQAIHYLRSEKGLQDQRKHFHNIFTLDPCYRPIGVLPSHYLLLYPKDTPLSEIMDGKNITIPATMNREEAALLFRKYNLISAPVIDEIGRLSGMVTVDDMLEVVEQEATEDIMSLGRVENVDFQAPLLVRSFWRLRWLFVTFLNTLLASSVLYQFQDVLSQVVAVAILMPIVAAMGGNAGMQVVTLMVRALATKELYAKKVGMLLMKELSMSAVIGLVFAGVLTAVATFWFQDCYLGFVLGAAMLFNIIWAGLAGTLFPLILEKLGLDPAMGAGPLLTTTTDVLGFACFLWLARLFLL